jgi:hypothetical protein
VLGKVYIAIPWVLLSWVLNWRFEGRYCFHHQDASWRLSAPSHCLKTASFWRAHVRVEVSVFDRVKSGRPTAWIMIHGYAVCIDIVVMRHVSNAEADLCVDCMCWCVQFAKLSLVLVCQFCQNTAALSQVLNGVSQLRKVNVAQWVILFFFDEVKFSIDKRDSTAQEKAQRLPCVYSAGCHMTLRQPTVSA